MLFRSVAASRHPDFKSMLGAAGPRVEPSSHPVVAMLARLGEAAVSLPLTVDGARLGQLVLLLPKPPEPEALSLMGAFDQRSQEYR